uniref:Retrotransposon gag domain-containing protein n=1 Tax=Cajanus cajan TaxID=3821 RepID=A0A151UE96_CAJCA
MQRKNVEGTPPIARGESSTSLAHPPGFTLTPAQPLTLHLNKSSQQVDPPEVQWPPYGLPPNYTPPTIMDPPDKHQPWVNQPPTQMQSTQPEVSPINVASYKHQVPYQPQNSNQGNPHQTSEGYQPTCRIEHVQSSEKLQMLEERLKIVEGGSYDVGEAVDLCLVPDIEFSPKFKVPEFDKYKGTSCPKNHITLYCRKMPAYARNCRHPISNDKLLIHCFQDSLTRAALNWYMHLEQAYIRSWKDLADAFHKQYKYNIDMFDPIPMSYTVLFPLLLQNSLVVPCSMKPIEPPYPRGYDVNAKYDYHAGAIGHSLENCRALKIKVLRLGG